MVFVGHICVFFILIIVLIPVLVSDQLRILNHQTDCVEYLKKKNIII